MRVCGKDIEVTGRALRVGRLAADGYDFLDDPEMLLSALRRSAAKIDLFSFMQRLPESSPRYSYPMEWDNFAALPVSTFEYWWNEQIRCYPRNRARQAEKKGVTLREVSFDETLVRGIVEIYNECRVRQGRPFRHYGKDFQRIYAEEATFLERSIFIGAFLGEQLIGFVKLVQDEAGMQAGLMNIVSMLRHRDKAPTNALLAKAVRCCAERGIQYLSYQQFSYGKKKHDSVTHFKEINGFQQINIPRYYVPLTLVGSVAFRLGMHRRLVDHFPESFVGHVRNLRNSWYNRRLHVSPESL
jgi:hypothetical protein